LCVCGARTGRRRAEGSAGGREDEEGKERETERSEQAEGRCEAEETEEGEVGCARARRADRSRSGRTGRQRLAVLLEAASIGALRIGVSPRRPGEVSRGRTLDVRRRGWCCRLGAASE